MKDGDIFIDDRVEIPEDIKRMSQKELEREILEFETMIKNKKTENTVKSYVV